VNLGSSIRRRRFTRRATPKDGESAGPTPWFGSRSSRLLAVAGLVLLGGVATGWIVSSQMLFHSPPLPQGLVAVPDLRTLSLTEALEELGGVGLAMGQSDSIRHPSAGQGTVLGQSPLPGQLSLPGAEVQVTYSMGPELREVPDVLRFRADRARTVLEATGFVVRFDSVESREFRGTVVDLEPRPGSELPLPGEIVVAVSLGPPMVAMPDIMGMIEEDALASLDSLGLLVPEVETRFRFGLDQGTVIEQEPEPEVMVEQGSEVRVVVARRGGAVRNNPPQKP